MTTLLELEAFSLISGKEVEVEITGSEDTDSVTVRFMHEEEDKGGKREMSMANRYRSSRVVFANHETIR